MLIFFLKRLSLLLSSCDISSGHPDTVTQQEELNCATDFRIPSDTNRNAI